MKALQNPSVISETAVKAQMTRRVLDRILGYKISPFVRKYTKVGKSAGRCQSPSLLLLLQKEKDIADALTKTQKRIKSQMIGIIQDKDKSDSDSKWEVVCDPLPSFPKQNWMKVDWKVHSVTKGNPTKSNPPPPFITSSLLSTAVNRLGYGTGIVKRMM